MKERIMQIMEESQMTPARFADTLEVGRAVISHILNGRNNPSLDIVMRILTKMPDINLEWLLTGKGSMYKNVAEVNILKSEYEMPNLFTQILAENSVKTNIRSEENKYEQKKVVENTEKQNYNIDNKSTIPIKAESRKIKEIIIYYTDNTYESFISESQS